MNLRLEVLRRFFFEYRRALGDLRQRTGDRDALTREMQDLCGQIESSLLNAQACLKTARLRP